MTKILLVVLIASLLIAGQPTGSAVSMGGGGGNVLCPLDADPDVPCLERGVGGSGGNSSSPSPSTSENYTKAPTVQVSAGGYHTCLLLSSAAVHCFGNNDDGQAEDYAQANVTAVSAGGYHTCVLLPTGNVDCYGNNDYDQAEDYLQGDAVQVSAGGLHTCVRTAVGRVHCWGDNSYGQLLDPFPLALDESYLLDAIDISAGATHTCMLTIGNRNLFCSGNNDYGQAPAATSVGGAVRLDVGTWQTCTLNDFGISLDCRGQMPEGEDYSVWGPARDSAVEILQWEIGEGLLLGAKNVSSSMFDAARDRVAAFSAGEGLTCVVLATGNVDCYGHLGWGNSYYRGELDYAGGNAVDVSVGYRHVCILVDGGAVNCFGPEYYES